MDARFLLGVQEVPGSNPGGPTINPPHSNTKLLPRLIVRRSACWAIPPHAATVARAPQYKEKDANAANEAQKLQVRKTFWINTSRGDKTSSKKRAPKKAIQGPAWTSSTMRRNSILGARFRLQAYIPESSL